MAFDAYHKWLGIPPAEQPPHHYRLLGVGLFEGDPDVIEGAADRQMGHVRTFQAGQHSALSQQILNELAAAKVCLLNTQRKAAYDAELHQRIDAREAATSPTGASRPRSIAAPLHVAGRAAANVTVADVACPDAALLSDFSLGKLDPPVTERISRHLAICADCCEKVANVSGDGFIDRLRAAGVAEAEAPHNLDRTFAERQAADGLETTIDLAKSPRRVLGRKPRASVPAHPELADHPDYEIVKELGRGGMGVVYLARNRLMDRHEVLKVLNKSLLDRPGALERFQHEIRSAAKLSHINIVAAYAVQRMGDSLVFAMEYVPGEDLAQLVARRGPVRVANAAYYAHQAALGMQHAHEKGMVHRDIKPNNLMLAVDGKKHIVKILDFGLAKATSEKDAETGLTKSGQILGTPDYLAPEQSRDAQGADIRADTYSLGCTLYFLLSGSRPFRESSLYDVLEAHQRREATPLDEVRPEVPRGLAAVVAKMMAKKPSGRYQTPVEVARALIPFFKPGQTRTAPEAPAHDDVETAPIPDPPKAADASALLAPAAWPALQPALPLSPLRAVPIALPLSKSAFDTSIEFETPLIDTEQDLEAPSRPWRFYLATCLAPIVLMLGIAILVRTPRGTIQKNAPLKVALTEEKRGGEWTSLFNGRDLSGWTATGYRGWEVKDGTLVNEGGNRLGWLMSDQEYSDFELEMEYNLASKGKSGVYLRAWQGGHISGKDFHEVQLLDDDAIEFATVPDNVKNGAVLGEIAATPRVAAPAGAWNRLRIGVRANHAQVSVNGVQVANGHLVPGKPKAGRLGLQLSEKGVAFRNIRVRELSAGAQDKAGPDGFVALFNGKDLSGWKTHPQGTGKWVVEQGAIVGRGIDQSHLFTERGDFEDFDLRVEAKINSGNSGVCFRTSYFGQGRLQGNGYEANIEGDRSHRWQTGSLMHVGPKGEVVTQLVEPDQWFDMEVIAVGNRITIKVNDKTTVDIADPERTYRRGNLALQQLGSQTEVRFRRIEIRELSSTGATTQTTTSKSDDFFGANAKNEGIAAAGTRNAPDLAPIITRDGYTALLNGRDFNGWVFPERPGGLKLESGVVRLTERNNYLVTKRTDFKNFKLRMEVSASKGTKATIVFHQQGPPSAGTAVTSAINDDGTAVVAGMQGPNYSFEQKGWENGMKRKSTTYDRLFTVEVSMKNMEAWISVDGVVTSGVGWQGRVDNGQGALGVVVRKGMLVIRKVEVKEDR